MLGRSVLVLAQVSLLSALVLGSGAGCGAGATCERLAPGMDRDLCLHDRIMALPGEQHADALALARQIQDPVVRGAAVFTWVIQHNREIDPKAGQALCGLLMGQERETCTRKLSQVHLRR